MLMFMMYLTFLKNDSNQTQAKMIPMILHQYGEKNLSDL